MRTMRIASKLCVSVIEIEDVVFNYNFVLIVLLSVVAKSSAKISCVGTDSSSYFLFEIKEMNRAKTREELLAEERDYKRRRMSYRGKKQKRTTLQVGIWFWFCKVSFFFPWIPQFQVLLLSLSKLLFSSFISVFGFTYTGYAGHNRRIHG